MRLRSGSNMAHGAFARVAVATMTLVAGVVFATPAPAGAASAWQTQTSPNVAAAANSALSSVACPSASNCFAVGTSTGVASTASLIEHWDGRTWSIVHAPDPSGASASRLLGIGCFDQSNCIASGDYEVNGHHKGLIERWNGSTWSVIPFPEVFQLSQLASVACPAAKTCFVVGSHYGHVIDPLVARWNGSTWSFLATPAVASSFALEGVACPTVSSCLAVGALSSGSLAEKWDGAHWSLVANANGDVSSSLSGVACPSVSMCFAVGSDGEEVPVIQRYDGTSLSDVAAPAGTGSTLLTSVACTSASNCIAVGQQQGLTPTLIEQWNGTDWSVVGSPTEPGEFNGSLSGVACGGASACFAVGSVGGPPEVTIADRWDGSTWSRQDTPTPAPSADVLAAVTCPSATSCVAVGHYDTESFADPPDDTPLIERWNGTSWSIDSNIAGAFTQLVGVACPTSTRCFAVGTQSDIDFDINAEIAQWDGSHWAPITPQIPGGELNQLFGVTCASTKRCFAFGYYYPAGRHVALVEQWNGTTWSAMANPAVNFGSLYSASCPTTTTCFAVGLMNGEGAPTTLIDRWNGSKWSVMTSPAPAGETFSQLSSVSCTSTTSCFAVGKYFLGNSIFTPTRPFAEQWDGKKWRLVAGLSPSGTTSGELTSVTCAGAASCIAVGDYTIANITKPLVERWNGSRWSFDASPVPTGVRSTILSGTACRAPIGCFVVGNTTTRDSQATFVQHHA